MDDNQVQVSPPGFHVIFLPFAEDVRKLQLPELEEEDKGELLLCVCVCLCVFNGVFSLPSANNEQIDKAKEIVKKLMFKFRSESFENPGKITSSLHHVKSIATYT